MQKYRLISMNQLNNCAFKLSLLYVYAKSIENDLKWLSTQTPNLQTEAEAVFNILTKLQRKLSKLIIHSPNG